MDVVTVHKINQCILRIRSGEGAPAIEELYGYIGNTLRIVAVKYFKSTPDIDDIVQDFWANVETFCRKYRLLKNGYYYLLTCFENLCKMKLRAEKRPVGRLSVEDIGLLEGVLAAKEEISERQVLLQVAFEKAREGMTERERMVMTLLVHGDMTVRRIAEELSLSKSQAGRLVKTVMEKLKITLKEEGWDKND